MTGFKIEGKTNRMLDLLSMFLNCFSCVSTLLLLQLVHGISI